MGLGAAEERGGDGGDARRAVEGTVGMMQVLGREIDGLKKEKEERVGRDIDGQGRDGEEMGFGFCVSGELAGPAGKRGGGSGRERADACSLGRIGGASWGDAESEDNVS